MTYKCYLYACQYVCSLSVQIFTSRFIDEVAKRFNDIIRNEEDNLAESDVKTAVEQAIVEEFVWVSLGSPGRHWNDGLYP